MSDPLVRFLIVLGVAVLAAFIVFVIRNRGSKQTIRLEQSLLGPGIYLFTSSTCAECGPARGRLATAVGQDGFREIDWETDPGVFEELQVGEVPATLVVDDLNRSTLYPGDTAQALEALNP